MTNFVQREFPYIRSHTIIRCVGECRLWQNHQGELYIPYYLKLESVRVNVKVGSRSLENKIAAALWFRIIGGIHGRTRDIEFDVLSAYNEDLKLNPPLFMESQCGAYYYLWIDNMIDNMIDGKRRDSDDEMKDVPTDKRVKIGRKRGMRMLEVEPDEPEEEPKPKEPTLIDEFNEYEGLKVIELVIKGVNMDDPPQAGQQLY